MVMMPIFTGLILIVTAMLDYVWGMVFKDDDKNANKAKFVIVIGLVCLGLWVIWLQHQNDVQADKNTNFVKSQLALANESLTNATLTIKGMNDGGNTYADPTFFIEYGANESTNSLKVELDQKGDFPVRGVSVTILNESKHSKVYDHYVGDLSYYPWNPPPVLCDIPLDSFITNHIQIDIKELNGYSYQKYDISRVIDGWVVKLTYLRRNIQEISIVEAATNSTGLDSETLNF